MPGGPDTVSGELDRQCFLRRYTESADCLCKPTTAANPATLQKGVHIADVLPAAPGKKAALALDHCKQMCICTRLPRSKYVESVGIVCANVRNSQNKVGTSLYYIPIWTF